MDDLALVERARAGDTAAFYALVRRHERSVFWAAFGLLGNAADAEDVAQEAFLKCFQKLNQFRGEAKFRTWLVQIAVNEARQRLRKNRPALYESLDRGENQDDAGGKMPRDLSDWRKDPEQQYAQEELRGIVNEALASLPPAYRIALVLHDLEQLSSDEVAQALGLSLPAAKSRVLRARLQLREKLAAHFRGGGAAAAKGGWWGRLARLGRRGE